MAITLRDNTSNNTGKGAELTYLEMDTNLESFYYSSSLSGSSLELFTTGSTCHVVDLTSVVGSGVQGAQGISGINGAQGTQGIAGGASAQGIQGIQGSQGTEGASIQGVQGTSGEASAQGLQGLQGTVGEGTQGPAGTGAQGPQGTTGTGTQGLQGITGTGTPGTQGIQGPQGSTPSVTDEYRRAFINSPDDIQYIVDSNTTEVVIGDATPLGASVIDEINGRTILINQDNTINGTLRFGFASWTGQASSTATSRQTFECTGYNIGQNDFNIGVYLPQGTWSIYQVGHNNGGGNLVSEYQTSVVIGSGGAPRYFTRAMQEGAMFKVYYNYFHKKVVIWCSHWSGTFAASGAVTFSGTNPN